MRVNIFLVIVLISSVVWLFGCQAEEPAPELPYYRIPQDIQAFVPQPIRGGGVRPKLMELLGLESLPTRVEVTREATVSGDDGIDSTRISFLNSLGETVPGLLMVPRGAAPQTLPGIVCMPGTSGSVDQISDERLYRERDGQGPLRGWARELARRGFATLAINLKGTVIRRRVFEDWEREAKMLIPYGRTQMGVLVEEALKAARVLEAEPAVDPARVGLTGFSLGSYATWMAAACDPSIPAVAVLCGGLGTLAAVIHEGDPDRSSSYCYIPHMLRYFDHPEIVAATIAPRPLMMLAPLRDQDMPRSGVDRLIEVVRPVYEEKGLAERFVVHRPDDEHNFRIEYFEWTVEWFKSQLGE